MRCILHILLNSPPIFPRPTDAGKDFAVRNSPPVNDHVEAGFVLAKRPEAMLTATEDDGHAVDHGLVEVAETEARLWLSVKVDKQVESSVEQVDYYIFY